MKSTSFKHFVSQYLQLSDDQLLSQAKSGDQQAFGELCVRYKGMLQRTILRIVRNREDTEDVLQDTFLATYKHLHAFRETCKFSTWMTRIGVNTSLTLLRKRRKSSETPADEFEMQEFRDPTPDPEQEYITGQASLTLRKAMQKLPPHMRSVMELYYIKEHLLKDAASNLGITEQNARSRVLRARRMLRRSLKKQCDLTIPSRDDGKPWHLCWHWFCCSRRTRRF